MTGRRAMDRFHNPYGESEETGGEVFNCWPTSRDLRGNDMVGDPLVFEQASFMHAAVLRESHLIRAYADVTGALSGGLSLRAVWSHDFSFRLAVEGEHVWPKYRGDGRSRRQKYMVAFVCRAV